jgi:hypothetical protein
MLRVGRLASTQSDRPVSRQNAVRALAKSLVIHGLTGGAKSSQNLLEQKTIQVIDPQTRQEVTVDLRKVQPFTHEFSLLPLPYRTLVERRQLLATLRERQATVHDIESTEDHDSDPNNALVRKFIQESLERRRQNTDKPPSDWKIDRYIATANEKAIKEARERNSSRTSQEGSNDNLSFEQQWNRRQIYRTS